VKHEIEYGDHGISGWYCDDVKDFLTKNGVSICETTSEDYGNIEWEIDKDELRALTDKAYWDAADELMFTDDFTETDLRRFVKSCIDAPTGEYAYVSWF
jgi:hypothetical protein